MIPVNLTHSELLLAAYVGCMRRSENVFRGGSHNYGATNDTAWKIDVEGAAGEMAAAKALNLYWSGKGVLGRGDVGQLQIRTRSKHDYDLILHPGDADDSVYVLVTGIAPCFIVRGWMLGRDGKQEEYWRDPAGGRPAFFVPQCKLSPPEALIRGNHHGTDGQRHPAGDSHGARAGPADPGDPAQGQGDRRRA